MAGSQRPTGGERIRLIHGKPAEAAERIAGLRSAGYIVACSTMSPALLREIRRDPPDAVVVDLARSPAMGRDVAIWVRKTKSTRHLPLVVVEGDPDKTERVRSLLPDAVFTPWSRIRGSLRRALARPHGDPVVPNSLLSGYSGTPLPRKLGIKSGTVVGLIGAPADFECTLGTLPASAVLRRPARGRCDLLLWFPRSQAELLRRVGRIGERVGADGLWIVWPKKASGIRTDLTQTEVRRAGLDSGLVDYKICAIDDDYSGLKFTRRRREKK
jgi:CheY-like chemotaxis protein